VFKHVAGYDEIEMSRREIELNLFDVTCEDGVNLKISPRDRGDFRHQFNPGHEFRRPFPFQKQ